MEAHIVAADSQGANAILARLSALARLSPQEIGIVAGLPRLARSHPAHVELFCEGSVGYPLVLLSGWVCHQRVLGDGRRQIIQFLVPGDTIGSLTRPSLPASCGVVSLTPVLVADARPLLRSAEDSGLPHAGLAEAIAWMAQADAICWRDQVVRLGRQTAFERLLHLLLELHSRLEVVGMVSGNSFPLPLTQEILADALGLSVVHVNRTLQQARRERLLDMRSGRVTLHRRDTMRSLAEGTGLAAA